MLGRKGVCGAALLALGLMNLQARAQMSATGTIQSTQVSANSYRYDLSFTNTGSVPIETVWFGWVLPYFDLLPDAPTSFNQPSGWFGFDAPDFNTLHSAQWYSFSAPIQPGATLSGFSITTPDSPDVMFSPSPTYRVQPDYTYVYPAWPPDTGGLVQGAFTPAAATPEPGSAMLLGAALSGLLLRRARR